MLETDLFLLFARKLNELSVPYMVTGSVAGVIYGEPRVTHDVDIVLVLAPRAVRQFAAAFPLEEFYCPPEEVLVQEALRRQRGHFNLIHHQSGFRADIYLANRDPLHEWALEERQCLKVDGVDLWVAPVEYVVVRKLQYFREGGSEKHLRDIASMLVVSGEDVRIRIIERWVGKLGLAKEWERASKYD